MIEWEVMIHIIGNCLAFLKNSDDWRIIDFSCNWMRTRYFLKEQKEATIGWEKRRYYWVKRSNSLIEGIDIIVTISVIIPLCPILRTYHTRSNFSYVFNVNQKAREYSINYGTLRIKFHQMWVKLEESDKIRPISPPHFQVPFPTDDWLFWDLEKRNFQLSSFPLSSVLQLPLSLFSFLFSLSLKVPRKSLISLF